VNLPNETFRHLCGTVITRAICWQKKRGDHERMAGGSIPFRNRPKPLNDIPKMLLGVPCNPFIMWAISLFAYTFLSFKPVLFRPETVVDRTLKLNERRKVQAIRRQRIPHSNDTLRDNENLILHGYIFRAAVSAIQLALLSCTYCVFIVHYCSTTHYS